MAGLTGNLFELSCTANAHGVHHTEQANAPLPGPCPWPGPHLHLLVLVPQLLLLMLEVVTLLIQLLQT